MAHFGDRLAQAVCRCGNPVVVGLDPRSDQLPGSLAQSARAGHVAAAAAYVEFCRGVIDVVAPLVPAVKPQAAFFEQLGPAGMSALADVIQHARRRGLLVILDAKRGDIGSTAQAYAEGILGGGESDGPANAESQTGWDADAVTVNPYLGDDSLTPFVEVAQRRGAGVFVLVKTSNPGGRLFQDLVAEGRPVYRHVAEHVETLAQQTAGDCGYGAVGAVVGATYPEQLRELRTTMPHAWLLVPGYGSQGATAADVAGAFDAQGLGAIVNNSRAIIFAHARPEYAQRFGAARWQEAVESATRQMIAELGEHTTARRLASC